MNDAAPQESKAPPARRVPWDWLLFLVGVALGVFDSAALLWLGANLALAGRDVTLVFLAYFTVSFGVVGFAVGRVIQARERARRDAETIGRQLRALAESPRARLENEKLAALGRAAAAIAHEVRNPLGVIRASATLAQERLPPGDDAHRACEFIREEVDRLNGVITALLDFARPVQPHWQKVSIEKLIERARQLAEPELVQRELAARVETVGSLPEIESSPDLLAQVLLDLMVNAAQAMEGSGRAEIVLRASAVRDSVALEVADAGPGVAPEHRAHIFEPFFTTRPRGTGLGLAVASRIVEAHGGQLTLEDGRGSGPGGAGACFRVTLPRERQP